MTISSPSPSSPATPTVESQNLSGPQAKAVHPSIQPVASKRTKYKVRTKRPADVPRVPRKYEYLHTLEQIGPAGKPLWILSPR